MHVAVCIPAVCMPATAIHKEASAMSPASESSTTTHRSIAYRLLNLMVIFGLVASLVFVPGVRPAMAAPAGTVAAHQGG